MSIYTLLLLLAVVGCAVVSADYRDSDTYNYYFRRYDQLHRRPFGYSGYSKGKGYSRASSSRGGYSSGSSRRGGYSRDNYYYRDIHPRKYYFGNGNDNGNCDGNCEDNNSGNDNGNKNHGFDNGNGNGNCRGNCFNNENGNRNGNKNKGVGNGNNNGNCVGNCFHNKLGNDNGNGNSKKGNQGNNQGNCFGNCFHLKDGNGVGNNDCGDYYYCGHYDHRRGQNCQGNCISHAPDLHVDLGRLPRTYRGDLTCTDHGGDTYYIHPNTNCNGIYHYAKSGGMKKFNCGMKATFDLSICACNHWYFTDYQKTCKSGMKRKE